MAAVLFFNACALRGGPGKHDVAPDWKRFTELHPRSFSPSVVRGDGFQIEFTSAEVEEQRTVLGSEAWIVRMKGTIINQGRHDLSLTELAGLGFVFVDANGARYNGLVGQLADPTGWEPRPGDASFKTAAPHLPPDARAPLGCWAPLLRKEAPEEPLVLVLGDQRIVLTPPQ